MTIKKSDNIKIVNPSFENNTNIGANMPLKRLMPLASVNLI